MNEEAAVERDMEEDEDFSPEIRPLMSFLYPLLSILFVFMSNLE